MSGISSYTSHNNRKKVYIDEIGGNIFFVSKSDPLKRTTRRIADYVGKKYGGSARHGI